MYCTLHVHFTHPQGARAAYGDYQSYPEGRPIFLPEAERFGNPPDLPSLLLQQRIIYISMPVCVAWGGISLEPRPNKHAIWPQKQLQH
jgi:hypothetical protein